MINIHTLLLAWRPLAALATLAATAAALVSAPAMGGSVTYTGAKCTSFTVAGTPPNQTVTCVGTSSGVPVCTPTAVPATPAAGTLTTISANCSNSPSSYLWSGGSCGGLTTPTCSVAKTAPKSVTYFVRASNAAGPGADAQITITWH